ncbi:hypothetical protein HZ326_27423 [Fusarium oxysporum f. sp. albedinis]|nr:hypothetical protein HZ326_27423 [Fusarium oxysporum f. sp. albedinis]
MIKGARAYFMQNILHDWEDKQATGYSTLLIHESIINSVGPLARVMTADIAMMTCLDAKERTENEWCQLIESVWLTVLKIW